MRITFLGNHAISYSTETHHAKSLEALGHEVVRLQEPQTPAAAIESEALKSDLFIWTHTHGWNTPGIERTLTALRTAGVPIVAYHLDLYMGLQRWKTYEQDPYMQQIDHFFTVDKLMADWLNENTAVKGHFLPAGVFDQECYIADEPDPRGNDVIFVGSRGYHPEWPWRARLLDWLRSTYGPRFTHVGADGDTGSVRGAELNRIYASSKVAVGDTLCLNFDYPFYASDRLFECPGRGGAQVFPRIKGLDEWFTDGEHLRFFTFGDFTDLKTQIDYLLEHDEEREQMRKAGHELVKNRHTYVHRWETILETVFA